MIPKDCIARLAMKIGNAAELAEAIHHCSEIYAQSMQLWKQDGETKLKHEADLKALRKRRSEMETACRHLDEEWESDGNGHSSKVCRVCGRRE